MACGGFRCPKCKRTYTEAHKRMLGTMYIPQDRAALAIQLLLEGNSIRSTERITKLDRNTICVCCFWLGNNAKPSWIPKCAAFYEALAD